ncbi:serine protease gd-like isoform X4 [Cimex lectularius]|uniref:Peptidase S1 domain-containing protein n=1 Tax=Cimex lectularius TaxID=79782 RepID=A0A8I6SQ44_CIMLE|nr:serine protease gd-like isoform X4 [Cimex lectularius]
MKLAIWLLLFSLSGDCFFLPYSPCPELFRYHSESNIWTGRLRVNITNLQFPIVVKLELGLKAVLKTKYVGLIELSEPAEIVIEKIIHRGVREIQYIIRFPLPFPLPILKGIYLQHKLVCSGIQVVGDVVTNIYLVHKFPTNPRLRNYKLSTTPGEICGKRSSHVRNRVKTLSSSEEWPWLAAILIKSKNYAYGLKFHCSGNLISNIHLITAGHCIKTHKEQFEVDDFITYFGKHNLLKWGEPNSQIRHVSNIYLHPDFQIEHYEADLAIVQLSTAVIFNQFVTPVCLWPDSHALDSLEGQYGTVGGWGKDILTNTVYNEPRIFKMCIFNQEDCMKNRKEFMFVTSNTTLCAGIKNGSGPCNGDSGSGLMVKSRTDKNEEIWVLRGIVSLSLVDEYTYSCDLSNLQIFTDVAKYKSWILKIIK